jgi:N-methylhydantoinase A/oxoprolinase/acetone carboxylase beta subunit
MVVLGVDVGGTNTDLIMSGVEGPGVVVHKLPTTKDDPARATVEGTLELCAMAGLAPGDIELVLHGTTVATNALLEHDGARTGMLTTAGFRDIIHIGRHQRPHNFSLMQDIPFQRWPLVERKFRKAVPERIIPPGEVATPLDEEATVAAIRELREHGVESICVCFLFSFLNPAHELRAGELIAEHHPDADISLSHQVIAQFREFERFTTTAVNAFIKPKVRTYLQRLEAGWRNAGVGCPIHIMQSNGGVAAVGQASERAVNVLLSGPAAGVIAGRHIGTLAGHSHLITLDIGGTSADISVIPGRLLELNLMDSYMGGYPILSPKLDVTAIGAGGGSVAWADAGGAFNVGPRSAGAEPGPACYGKGGTEATVTDAHLVLGRVDPGAFLGGRMELRTDLARAAVEAIGSEFGMDGEAAALAILRIVNANMVREIRVHSIRRGYDPRECALVAFGGAGPLHACEIAEELDIPVILLPPSPGITSAMGLLATDLKYDAVRTVGLMLDSAEREVLDERFAAMEVELAERFAGHTGAAPTLRREASCRYAGQGYELSAPCDELGEDWRARIEAGFHAQHEHEYGFRFPNDPVEIISLRVTAVSEISARPEQPLERGGEDPGHALAGMTDVVFAGGGGGEPDHRSVPTYRREGLLAGARIPGPAMVLEMDSTLVIAPAWEGEVLADGTVRLTRREQS